MKRIISLLLCLAAIFLTALPVLAHPGKTDSNGGHTDHSTDEYHYHHGYPAHDHYDMDGDGKIDCPYDFIDKTDRTQDNSSRSDSIYSQSSESKEPTPTKSEENIVEIWIVCVMASILLFVIGLMYLKLRDRNEEIERLKCDLIAEQANTKKAMDRQKALLNERFCATPFVSEIRTLESMVSSLRDQLSQEKNNALSLLSENGELRSQISELTAAVSKHSIDNSDLPIENPLEIPPDIYFINGSVPVRGIISDRKPFGDFTVYVAYRGRRYHTNYFCGSALLYAEHAYEVIEKLPPCKNCGYFFQEPVPDWYRKLKGTSVNLNIQKPIPDAEQLEISFYEN